MKDNNRLKKIIHGAKLGYTMDELSEIINVSPSTIRRTLKENGYGISWYKNVSDKARLYNLCNEVLNEMIFNDKNPLEATDGFNVSIGVFKSKNI